MMEMSASAPLRGNRAYISLGSNLGDSLQTLRRAAAALEGLGAVVAASPVYETDPVGLREQPAFLNAVVELDTTLEPLPLLDALLAIEEEGGRERGIRFGPRTLDLDLIWYDGRQLESDRLRTLSCHQDQGAANEDGSEAGQHGASPMPVGDIQGDLVEVQRHRDEHEAGQGRGTAAHHQEIVVPASGVERHRGLQCTGASA